MQQSISGFDSNLKEDDVPVIEKWDTGVTESIAFTFSDKLMMLYNTSLIAISIGFYGTSMAMSQMRDLGLNYTRLTAEIALYAEDGANIMIKNGWHDQPLNRDESTKK